MLVTAVHIFSGGMLSVSTGTTIVSPGPMFRLEFRNQPSLDEATT